MTYHLALRLGVALPSVAVVGASAVILAVAIAAPLAQAILGYPSGEPFYESLYSICHQYPSRSIWILGHPCALCSRCLGGYSGVLLLSLVYFAGVLRRMDIKLFVILSTSLIVLGVGDAVLKFATGIDGSNAWRFATGLFGGMGFAMVLALPWKRTVV